MHYKHSIKQKLGMFAAASVLFAGVSLSAIAGPIIIGGDDLTDHGNNLGAGGANQQGWKYIELAITDLNSSQTRGGAITTDIVALGSAFADYTSIHSGNAGAAIGSAANAAGLSVTFVDTAAAITQFFIDLAAGTINPKILWIAGTGAANDLDSAEGVALANNAAAINTFGASGGGIMAHGSGTTAFGWLSALLPGIDFTGACNSSGATLTAAGQAAFPGLSDSDINSSAGPCHNTFSGNLGGLTVLARDGLQRALIIGGGTGTVIRCGQPGQPPCPTVPTPGTMPLLGLGLLGLIAGLRRRKLH